MTALKSGRQSLDTYPFPQALAELAADNAAGMLTVSRRGREKRLLFKEGAPVHFESNIADESLERFLLKRGKLDQTTAFQAQGRAVAEHRPVGDVLVEMGALGPNDLFKMMKLCMGASILETFRWADGELKFDPQEVPQAGTILLKVNSGPLVVRGVFAYSPFDMISKHFLAFKSDSFRLAQKANDFVPALQLNPVQARIAQALETASSPNQVVQRADVDMETALRVLYALMLLRVVVPADRASATPVQPLESGGVHERVGTAHVQKRATSPLKKEDQGRQVADMSTKPSELTTDEQEAIDNAYHIAKEGTYYQLLDVAADVSFSSLKRSFLKACFQFSPMTFRDRNLGNRAEKVEELFLILVRAFWTLAVPEQREHYNDKLENPDDLRKTMAGMGARTSVKRGDDAGGEKRPESQNTKSVQTAFSVSVSKGANLLVKAGASYLNKRRSAEAVEQLKLAAEGQPDDAEAVSLLGYALYLVDPVGNRMKGLDCLRRAVELDSTRYQAHLLLGRVLEQEQQRADALEAYQACLARAPGQSEAKTAIERLKRVLRH